MEDGLFEMSTPPARPGGGSGRGSDAVPGGSLADSDRRSAPLAVRMRPRTLDELVGQGQLRAPGSPLRQLVDGGQSLSLLLWGPPGTGKTTIASILSRQTDRQFVEVSAVSAGVKEVRAAIVEARRRLVADGTETVLFVDEVHRFSKAQQDALLPGVENRWVTLVAATTENPFFSVISPLLSRSLLLRLESLTDDDVREVLRRALTDERGLGGEVAIDDDALEHLVRLAGGDARRGLTYLEAAVGAVPAGGLDTSSPGGSDYSTTGGRGSGGLDTSSPGGSDYSTSGGRGSSGGGRGSSSERSERIETAVSGGLDTSSPGGSDYSTTGGRGSSSERSERIERIETRVIDLAAAEKAVDQAAVRYDKDGDQHYDVISAFIKSVRGSDVDAALHYLARMIEAGEDPRFIARRLMILASEDIGLADPTALTTAVAAAQTVQLIGMPEAQLTLAHATIALAVAAKSNAVTTALAAAQADVRAGKIGAVPPHLRDAHYAAAKRLDHGSGYKYAHDEPFGIAEQQYAPDAIGDAAYYQPTSYGAEAAVKERWERVRRIIRGVTRS